MAKKNAAIGKKKMHADDVLILAVSLIILVVTIYPIYYVLIASFSDPARVLRGEVVLFPIGFSFKGYLSVFQDGRIMKGLVNTVIYSFLGTLVNLIVTLPAAYALSRREFKLRKIINIYFVFTMFFNGGIIATYIVLKNVGLVNTRLIFIVGFCFSVYNMIITRTFFENSIPEQLRDAARLDGCGHFRYFMSIVLPLSKAIIAVIALYYFVWHWNDFFTGLVYTSKEELLPMQNVLRKIILSNQTNLSGSVSFTQLSLQEQIKYASIVVATIPLVIIYPFLQKYFDKGVMIGAVKE